MSPSKSKETKERLGILNQSNDGFFIAGEDLRLRGPGDLFGIRQSGLMDFKLGDVFQDSLILKQAAEAAGELLRTDPGLKSERNRAAGRSLKTLSVRCDVRNDTLKIPELTRLKIKFLHILWM